MKSLSKNLKPTLLTLLFLISKIFLFAQTDSTKKITYSAYGEFYYSYDFAKPQNHEKPTFLYNHKKHNELNANLLLVKANYLDKTMRANLTVMAGNYAQYNLSAEPNWAQNIYEANIGVKISKHKNIWLDAGIMPSHIGSESAISADCWTLTRGLAAENSPYYEAGVKLSYGSNNEKLNIAFLILNGWQKIQRPSFIQMPSVGIQANYKVNKNIFINYSNFIGTDKPDSLKALRTYHNVYAQINLSEKTDVLASIDIGTDKYNISDYGVWYSPSFTIKHNVNNKTTLAFRGEYFSDTKQIIIATNTMNGFKTLGVSANIDRKINSSVQWRVEGKLYQSKDKIFDNNQHNNFSLTTNLSFRL